METTTTCWQYLIRQKNLNNDLKEDSISPEEMASLCTGDFEFAYIPRGDGETCRRIKNFIIRHEWLGKMPHRPTHRFVATYKGKLAGVIVMATPNAFARFLGPESRDMEKLISRGACISWSPKNLASTLLMFSIRWMVKNTPYRLFSAYSDTTAGEIGTIYQACNFIYLGQNSGATYQYFDPLCPERGWFSDRLFRKTSFIKRYAQILGIPWHQSWQEKDRICWERMPEEVAFRFKKVVKKHQNGCLKKKIPRKHKYLYILGKSKRETQKLRQRFEELKPSLVGLPYPPKRLLSRRYSHKEADSADKRLRN